LDYDFSLHKVVELAVVFPTSLGSSKMESGYSRYCRFHFGVSASFRVARISEVPVGNFHGPEIADVFLRFLKPGVVLPLRYGGQQFV
jgi:hypothetical protein